MSTSVEKNWKGSWREDIYRMEGPFPVKEIIMEIFVVLNVYT